MWVSASAAPHMRGRTTVACAVYMLGDAVWTGSISRVGIRIGRHGESLVILLRPFVLLQAPRAVGEPRVTPSGLLTVRKLETGFSLNSPFPIHGCVDERDKSEEDKNRFTYYERRLLVHLFVDVVEPSPRQPLFVPLKPFQHDRF